MPMVTRLLRTDDACDTIGVLAKINADVYKQKLLAVLANLKTLIEWRRQ
jgi:hypothetical protein